MDEVEPTFTVKKLSDLLRIPKPSIFGRLKLMDFKKTSGQMIRLNCLETLKLTQLGSKRANGNVVKLLERIVFLERQLASKEKC